MAERSAGAPLTAEVVHAASVEAVVKRHASINAGSDRILVFLFDLGADLFGAAVLDDFVDGESGARDERRNGRPGDSAGH